MKTIIGGFFLLGAILVTKVESHGRLIEPPSRASMWRYGFDTPHDYNDHECYCGGFSRQWQKNAGKCGICGDAWDAKKPRAHENGGKYGNNVIVRKYRTGSIIPVRVELTANHHGYFEFRTCAMTERRVEVTDECLDKYLLEMENGTARYFPGPGSRVFEAYYKLPDRLTCAQCVFQWRYVAGNNWGDCGNGTGAVGCGPQEEFRGCADITIGDNVSPLPPRPKAKPGVGTSTQSTDYTTETTFVPEYSQTYWLYNLIIAGTSLLVALSAIALIYAYYYHAGRAKKWLKSRRLLSSEKPPVAPPRHRKHTMTNIQLQI